MKSRVFLEHLTSDSLSEKKQLCSLELAPQLNSSGNSGYALSQARTDVRAMNENSSWAGTTELSSEAIFPEHREKEQYEGESTKAIYSIKISLKSRRQHRENTNFFFHQ